LNVILAFLFLITGLVLGSFFNVIGLRLPIGKTFWESNDRSYCPHCKTRLSWYELIPLFSFLVQKASCRHCKNKISWLYPVVECLTGFLFAFSFVKIGLEWELLTALLFHSMLMIVLVTDLKYMLIPDRILLFSFHYSL